MADCYFLHSGVKKINYDDLPCEDVNQVGRNVTCCVRGSTCMSNGLCQNAGGDGYYSADCTDPTLEDPACQTRCGGFVGAQVIYNSTSKLWACCTYNDGKQNCSEPTDEVFPAPGPSSLKTIAYLPTTGSATYSTSLVAATSVSNTNTSPTSILNTSTSPASLSSSSNVSPGAAAGIGVGVGAGIILAAAVIAIILFKRRRPSETHKLDSSNSGSPQQYVVSELGNGPIIRELDNGRTMHELANSKAWP